MLSKEFLDSVSYPITQLYMASEDRLLAMIVNQLRQGTGNFDVAEWKIKKLSDMGGLTKQAYSEIAKTSKKATVLLKRVLSEVTQKSLSVDGVDTVETQGVLQTIQALQAQAQSHLNIVNTTMLAGTQDSYGNILAVLDNERNMILNNSALDLVTGQSSYQEVVAQAIRQLSDSGINAYVDKAGREWSPEGYVSMDMRTTSAQVARGVVEAQGRDYGLDVILVSSHAGARPKCAPYQGRCYSMSDRYGTIKDANGREWEFEPLSNTSYGEPDGLFGINCGHSFRYIEEGAFFNRENALDTKAEREKNARDYQLSQEQRSIEREIRQYSREAELLKEAGLTEFAKISEGQAREAKDVYREFCEQNNRTERWERTKIY